MLETIKDSHCVHQIGIHFVWCTKYRHPILVDIIEIRVKQIIGEICREYGWKCKTIEVMPDHIHLFLQINPSDSPENVVKTIKSITAVGIFYSFPKLNSSKFWGSGLWSRGTYYGSVGNCSQETIIRYIENQKKK